MVRKWKVYDLETGKIFVSCDVTFHENEFLYADMNEETGNIVSSTNNLVVDNDVMDDMEGG